MQRRLAILAVAVAACVAAPRAHHSIAGAYDSDRRVTIEGVVASFHFVNPHPYLTVETRDAAGARRTWRLELDNRRELSAVGITPDTFAPGDAVVVSGSPARRAPDGLYVRALERPADGFRYEQVGSSPQVRRRTPAR